MRSINSALFGLGLAVAPLAAAPHAYSQENHPSVGLFGASEIHSQSADPSSVELAQVTSTMPNPSPSSADTTISVKALLDAKVLDSSNREMGSIKTLLADPQTGKLVRADIGLKGNSGLMSKGDQPLSSLGAAQCKTAGRKLRAGAESRGDAEDTDDPKTRYFEQTNAAEEINAICTEWNGVKPLRFLRLRTPAGASSEPFGSAVRQRKRSIRSSARAIAM